MYKLVWTKKKGYNDKITYRLFVDGISTSYIEKPADDKEFSIYIDGKFSQHKALTLRDAKRWLLDTQTIFLNLEKYFDTEKFQDYIEKGRKEGFTEGSEFSFALKYVHFCIRDKAISMKNNLGFDENKALAEAVKLFYSLQGYYALNSI